MVKIFICLCSFLLMAYASSSDNRKTILVLSCGGGGGHVNAANAIQNLVGEEYNIKIIYPIDEMKIFGIPSCDKIYNVMLSKGWIRSVNFMIRHMAPPVFRSCFRRAEKLISASIKSHQADLVISLIPLINYPASEAARKNKIPFLLVTVDNDLRNWMLDIKKMRHPLMKITIGEDLPTTRGLLLRQNISEELIETIGLPIKPDFMMYKDKKKILEKFAFPLNKEIILIMMGGAGGDIAYEYAKKIGRMPLGVHLVVIAGRNAKLKKQLEQMRLDPSNSLSAFGFTDQVADLMAVSNLLVTKPGPGTINEALTMKLPMLIDTTASSLFWERANIDIVLKYGVGQKIKRIHQVRDLLYPYLKDEEFKERLKESFINVPSNQFHRRIPEIIQELLSQNSSKPL